MDNQADDVLMPTEFTEAWVPLSRTKQAMRVLRDYFAAPSDDATRPCAAPAPTLGSSMR